MKQTLIDACKRIDNRLAPVRSRLLIAQRFVAYHFPIPGFLIATAGGWMDRTAGLATESSWIQVIGSSMVLAAALSAKITFQRSNPRRWPAAGRAFLAVLATLPNFTLIIPTPAEVSTRGSSLYIMGRIDENMVRSLAIQLANLGCRPFNPTGAPSCPTTTLINSSGGSITSAIQISSLLDIAGIHTVAATGECMSACSSIVLATSKRRAATPGTLLGFHSAQNFSRDSDATGRPIFRSVSNALLSQKLQAAGLGEECVGSLLFTPVMAIATVNDLRSAGFQIETSVITGADNPPRLPKQWRPFPCREGAPDYISDDKPASAAFARFVIDHAPFLGKWLR